jgi:hypothetical protein
MGEAEVQLHSPLTLELVVRGQLHVPAILSPGKKPPLPIIFEAVGTPHPIWMFWRKGNPLAFARNLSLICNLCSPHSSHYINYAILPPLLSAIKLNCAKKI